MAAFCLLISENFSKKEKEIIMVLSTEGTISEKIHKLDEKMIHMQTSCHLWYLHLYKQIDMMVCKLGDSKYKSVKLALKNPAEKSVLLSFVEIHGSSSWFSQGLCSQCRKESQPIEDINS